MILRGIITILICSVCAAFGRDIYVSSSSGNDSNDGTQASPLKTIAAAPKENVNVFLKRGDVFFETVIGFTNAKIDAYGEGSKPLICGLKVLENQSAWEKMPNDVWRLDLANQANFSGYKAEGKKNNIGAVYDIKNDKVYGHLVARYNAISNYGDFWVSDKATNNNVQEKSENFRYLYFRSKNNPSQGDAKFGFSIYGFGVRNMRNCTVENIAIKGFGVHGICMAWNSTFRNIDIDLIGGSVQLSYPVWVRLGNGIEFWASDKTPCSNNLVENCKITRTYDCGATIQGIATGNIKIENVKFINNSFFRCRQAFEHFLRSKTGTAVYENCEFSNNKCFDMGENEFSSPEERDANLLSYEGKPVTGLLIKNNIFWGAPLYSAQTYTAEMRDNTFYIYKGQYLVFSRKNEGETIWANTEADIIAAKEKLKNPTDKIVIVERDDKRLRDEILETSFAEQKPAIIKKTREKYRRDFFFRK